MWDFMIVNITVHPEGEVLILVLLNTPFRAFKERLDHDEDEQEEKPCSYQYIFVEVEYLLRFIIITDTKQFFQYIVKFHVGA